MKPIPVTLNEKDSEILSVLSLNGRISVSDLAREVGLSKQVVSYRLHMLEEKSVIRRYYAITNIYALGKNHYRIFIKFRNRNGEMENQLRQYLMGHPQVSGLLLLDGDFDLFFVVWAGDIIHFERVYDDIMGRFGAFFGQKYFSIVTRIEYLPFRFLHGAHPPLSPQRSVVFGGEVANHILDETDKKILSALNQRGRISFTELGEMCGASQQLIKKKIQCMEAKKIIIGYNVKIDHILLGYTYRKVLLKLNSTSPEHLGELSGYLRRLNNVIFLLRTMGAYDFEFEMMSRSREEFYAQMRDIREGFAYNISEYSEVTLSSEPKYEHLEF